MKKIFTKTSIIFLALFSFSVLSVKADIHTINAGNYYYTPSSLTINTNDTVVWLNDAGYHDVNFDINTQTGVSFGNPVSFQSPASNALNQDTLYTYVFTVPGNYNYDCSIGSHAFAGMVGSINVVNTNSIYDIVSNSTDHGTLKLAINACNLGGTLSGPGPFTLFAPTDAAFNALPAGTVAALLADIPQLTDILLHHVIGDSVMSTMLSNGMMATTLLGTDVTVTINGGNVYIDNAMVTVADIVADNGVVHVIDAVLLPPAPTNSVYDIVSNSTDHGTLKTAINACNLGGTLSGPGPFTLFAPTDAAFNALPAGTVAALLADIPQLTDILLHHVIGDSVMSTMLSNGMMATTLLGTDVTVTINGGNVYIDNAMVTVADIVADNGVVHVIDAVLLPSTSSLVDNMFNNENDFIVKSIDMLGKIIPSDQIILNTIIFDIYKSGKIVKRLNVSTP